MYECQEETFSLLIESAKQIEQLTEDHYHIKIGWACFKDNRQTLGAQEILLHINGEHYFSVESGLFEYWEYLYFPSEKWEGYHIRLHSDCFLKLNSLIDTVINDNKQREEFYSNLNTHLTAFNHSLEDLEK